jgi:hypothetical protein
MEIPRGEDGMTRNLIVIGCAALLAFGLSFGSFAGSSPDSDSDGVPDAFDNCTAAANGPLLASGSCNAQEDYDTDGYGQPCDSDVNNDGFNGLDDVNVMLSQLGGAQNATGNLDCDALGTGLNDVNTALGLLGGAPGASGLACAGTGTPCSAQ